jgi:hypothetical protein
MNLKMRLGTQKEPRGMIRLDEIRVEVTSVVVTEGVILHAEKTRIGQAEKVHQESVR